MVVVAVVVAADVAAAFDAEIVGVTVKVTEIVPIAH